MADTETNALVINGPREEFEAVAAIVRQLDVPRRMIYLEASRQPSDGLARLARQPDGVQETLRAGDALPEGRAVVKIGRAHV